MKVVALDMSAQVSSAALVENGVCVAEQTWDEKMQASRDLFAVLPALLGDAGWSWNDVDVYAIGRGPGNYSGLRTSMTAVQAFALPREKTVYAISSGEVMAQQAARDPDAPSVVVLGDARRHRVWFSLFTREGDAFVPDGEWSLAVMPELGKRIPAGSLIVSPDWSRLKDAAARLKLSNVTWVEADVSPSASVLGLLVSGRIERGIPSEPLTPIYMHPPVFVKPRFAE